MEKILEYHKDENGEFHRPWQEGPAVVWSDGSYLYHEHGKPHRPWQEGPALYNSEENTYCYYTEGRIHRPVGDGPAFISDFEELFGEEDVFLFSSPKET